jgi:hypothetical protein
MIVIGYQEALEMLLTVREVSTKVRIFNSNRCAQLSLVRGSGFRSLTGPCFCRMEETLCYNCVCSRQSLVAQSCANVMIYYCTLSSYAVNIQCAKNWLISRM